MEGVGWILTIIIGGIAGWLAENIMKAAGHGLLLNIILGVVGAVVLNAILIALMGATFGGIIGQLVVAVIGACLLIWLYRLIRGGR
ncbi:GlsB/YeaQ/YmgE family stress response membrane protein [Chelativorans alearense]|uniref:GlsB/YeaQ/YmgE family stress response membrane protein n=1 Tax=Chelativorans alearense TaxID=2681495 RepID=UPI0013D74142|nr:GlsB/YeaQ/YmgE family stress response membrane protein [Chelativorans alearense]